MNNHATSIVIVLHEPDYKDFFSFLTILQSNNVFIIDNTFNSNKQLKALLNLRKFTLESSVKLITTNKNLGYAGGVNIGLKQSYESEYKWTTIINLDVSVTPAILSQYVKRLSTSKPGIAGIYPGSLDPWRWSTILEDNLRLDRGIEYLSGSFWSIHRDVVQQIGYLYERYFLYYEEVEYCVRAAKAGFPLLNFETIKAKHSGVSGLGKNSFLHQYYLARNHLHFVERNAPMKVKLHELARMPKTVAEHYQRGERGGLLGIRDFALRKFGQYKSKI